MLRIGEVKTAQGTYDLKGVNCEALNDPKVSLLLASEKSWSEMWLEYSRESYPYDHNFREVSDYAMKNRLQSN